MKLSEFNAFSEKDRMNRVLEGNAYFACVHSPDYSGAKKFKAPPVFKVTLGLDTENQAKAKSYGLEVKEATKDIPEPHVVIRRKVKEGKTPEQVKPIVVDSLQKPVPSKILIGNKSKVIVKFGTYFAENNNTVQTTLFKVQIRELVKYTPKDGLVMDESGFTVDDADDASDDTAPFDAGTESKIKFDDDDGFEAPKGN